MMTSFLISTTTIATLSYFYLRNEENLVSENQLLKRKKSREKGLALYRELQRINRHYLSARRDVELPQYKFFTHLCDELLLSFRSEGADIFPHLISVRKNLNRDLKAEKGLKSTLSGALAEMGIISLLSVSIFFFGKLMAELPLNSTDLMAALGSQGLGFLTLVFGARLIKQKTFKAFREHIRSASICDLGIRASMPLNLLAKKLKLAELEKDKDLEHVRERLDTIIKALKSGTLADLSQSEEAVEECWMVYDTKLSQYQTKLKALKLACIAAFFLSSYLYLFHSMIVSAGAI